MASLVLLASLVLSLLCISQADLISDVCSKALNPTLCNQIFSSDPRARGAGLPGLGLIIVEKAEATTWDTITVAKSVSNGSNAQIVNTCVVSSGDALSNLNECAALLKKPGTAGDLQTKGSAAQTDVGTCDDVFGNAEPPKLKEASKRAQDIIDILLVIANKL